MSNSKRVEIVDDWVESADDCWPRGATFVHTVHFVRIVHFLPKTAGRG